MTSTIVNNEKLLGEIYIYMQYCNSGINGCLDLNDPLVKANFI